MVCVFKIIVLFFIVYSFYYMLSQKTKYALKSLLYLSRQSERKSAKDIAQNCNIPLKFLEQILAELKRQGIINSQLGAQGGYFLILSPADITIVDIYRLFDGAIALLPCASERFYAPCKDCHDQEACKIRRALQLIRIQTLQTMSYITLESIDNSVF